MEIKFLNTISVIDNFISDNELVSWLKDESEINGTVKGQDTHNLTYAQNEFGKLANATLVNYCTSNNIDYNNLSMSNFQKGRLKKYDKSMVTNHLYEPHHDQVEGAFISAIYFIDNDYTPDKWVGGELCIYKNLTFAEYPSNVVNINPVPNRLVMFPGFLTHRVGK
jgi:hypothetical protein